MIDKTWTSLFRNSFIASLMITTMMCTYARFSLEPVGQGLFYTGKIGNFNMVYDCGELNGPNKIVNLIKDYKNKLGNSKIDMLIVSHLHWDHVCGFEELMRKTQVRYVFLPYLLPIQRLLLALSESANANQSYYNFLIDPVGYFVERSAEKVILIRGKEGGEDLGRFEPSDDGTPNESSGIDTEDLDDESIQLPDNDDLRKMVNENDPQLLGEKFKTHLSFKNHSGLVSLKHKWVFRFFAPPTNKNLKGLEACVMKILPGTREIDYGTLRNILSSKSDLDKLKICYENTFKRLNDTSLIVFHGPPKNISSFLCPSGSPTKIPMNYRFYPFKSSFESYDRFGWVLNGDVDFNKVWPAFLNHFSAYLDHMTHLLIPHHGSKGNWNSNIMSRVVNPSHWFVSFGLGNQYCQPNHDVISDIITKGNTVSICNETMRIDQYVFTGH